MFSRRKIIGLISALSPFSGRVAASEAAAANDPIILPQHFVDPIDRTAPSGQLIYDRRRSLRIADSAAPSGRLIPVGRDAVIAAGSIADLRNLNPELSTVICHGYHLPSDGGGGIFVWHASETRPDDGGIIIAPTSFKKEGRWRREGVAGEVDVKWFGAIGNGINDDTAAIDAAHKYAESLAQQLGYAWTIFFQPGNYIYLGVGIKFGSGSLVIRAIPNTMTLTIKSDVYLYTLSDRISSTFVAGITIIGGRGAFKYLYTQNNVAGLHVFSDCTFREYRECAIGNNSDDHPYLKVSRSIFHASIGHQTIGIAWGGYVDCLSIENSVFLLNTYHLKIGPRISGSVNISRNDFISFQRQVRKADIWIVPNTSDPHGVNAGGGFIISDNKFGNENMAESDSRILIAEEDPSSGGGRLERSHLGSISGEAFLSNLEISRNRIDGVGSLSAGFIRCFIENIWRVNFYSNVISGGRHPYFCEFIGPVNPSARTSVATWTVESGSAAPDGIPPFSIDITNRYSGYLKDDAGLMTGSTWSRIEDSSSDDTSYLSLYDGEDSNQYHIIRAKKSLVEGPLGTGSNAIELQTLISQQGGGVYVNLDSPHLEKKAWIEIDLKKSSRRSVEKVSVEVINTDNSRYAIRRIVRIEDAWRSSKIGFVFPEESSAWQVRVQPVGAINGMNDCFCVARLKVYHARHLMLSGHLRTIGSGAWNGEHIIMGQNHLWVDSAGMLRFKKSAPMHDMDGKKLLLSS